MPMYMQPTPSGYHLPRIVPIALRPILGQTAIVISLGKNYAAACRRAREEAVLSDQRFDTASALLAQRAAKGDTFAWFGRRRRSTTSSGEFGSWIS